MLYRMQDALVLQQAVKGESSPTQRMAGLRQEVWSTEVMNSSLAVRAWFITFAVFCGVESILALITHQYAHAVVLIPLFFFAFTAFGLPSDIQYGGRFRPYLPALACATVLGGILYFYLRWHSSVP